MIFDFTINIGNILTVVSFFAIGALFVGSIKNKVEEQSSRLVALEKEMKTLVQVLVQQGRHDEQIEGINSRIMAQGQRLDDLARKLDRFFEPIPKKS